MSELLAHRLRVYWEDTDAGGIVFHANHLKYLERARTEWLRSLGWGQHALREQLGVIFVVTEVNLRYRAPARIDDELDVSVAIAAPPRATIRLRQSIRRGAELLLEADIVLACVDAATLRARRIPAPLHQALIEATA